MAFNNVLPAWLFTEDVMKKTTIDDMLRESLRLEQAGITMEDYSDFVESLKTDKVVGSENRLVWACLELTAEAGEITSLLAKAQRKGLPIDLEHLKDELSDVLWGLVAVANDLDITLEDLMVYSRKKLQARLDSGIRYNATT